MSDCQNFPGLGTRQTDTQTDTQKLTFGSPGTPIPSQSLVKQMKWYENFMHKQRHGLVSHCALLIYNINGYLLYRRVQDVLHQPNHYEKILFPTILKDAHLFCKETTNQPQPQGLNPNQQAKVTAGTPNHVNRYSELPKPIPSLNKPGFVVLHFAGRSFADNYWGRMVPMETLQPISSLKTVRRGMSCVRTDMIHW